MSSSEPLYLGALTKALNLEFPLYAAEDWDNNGLLVGDIDDSVDGVLVALDCTDKVIAEAVDSKCSLIVTHHPLIFRGLKKITTADSLGAKVIHLLRNRMAVYSIHTPYDFETEGMWDCLDCLGWKR